MVKVRLARLATSALAFLFLSGFMVLAGPHLHNSAKTSAKFDVSFSVGRDLRIDLSAGSSFWDASKKPRRVRSLKVTAGDRVTEASAEMIAVKIRKPSRQYWIFDGQALCVVEQKRFKEKMMCPADSLRVEMEKANED